MLGPWADLLAYFVSIDPSQEPVALVVAEVAPLYVVGLAPLSVVVVVQRAAPHSLAAGAAPLSIVAEAAARVLAGVAPPLAVVVGFVVLQAAAAVAERLARAVERAYVPLRPVAVVGAVG